MFPFDSIHNYLQIVITCVDADLLKDKNVRDPKFGLKISRNIIPSIIHVFFNQIYALQIIIKL
jgi:hypothetical protein